MTESLQRISRYLRDLLLAMAGEDVDPDSVDREGFVDPAELSAMIDALAGPSQSNEQDKDKDSHYPQLQVRADWALERECEITRLEKENEELRKILGIDPESIAASGMDMEAEIQRMDRGRHPLLKDRRREGSGHMSTGSGEQWERLNNVNANNNNNNQMHMWDASKNPGINFGNQPPPQYTQEMTMSGGAPLQRSMELPTLRTAQGAGPRVGQRFVQPQQQQPRGTWVSGAGRAGPPSSQGSTLWTNQPHSPSPQVINDRPWPIQGGMDIGR